MTKFAEEYLTLKRPESPLLDVMGNEIIRGHVIAFSKSGRGERDVNIGVVTHITKRGKKVGHHSYSIWTAGAFTSEHRISPGSEGSVVILQDPLYSLNSPHIVKLFEKIEKLKGLEHGDLIEEKSYTGWGNSGIMWTEIAALWNETLPPDYQFGVCIDDEQMISVIDRTAIRRIAKAKLKARMEARKGDGKKWNCG